MRYPQVWTLQGKEPGASGYGTPFAAEVPGNIQWDYAKAFGLEQFAYADGVEAFQKIEDWSWKYTAQLSYEAACDDRIVFVAEGIDYEFEILLDGVCIHTQEGMYTSVELDITDRVQPGSLLEVCIKPHPKKDEPVAGDYRRHADQCCKPPVTYGWDWNPRLIISGIWKPAYIETRKVDHILSCEPFYTLNADRTVADVRFETVCSGDVTYTVYDPDGAVVYTGKDPSFSLDNIRLWWCAGQGEPALYRWTAESKSDRKSGRIGFRTVRLVRNENANVYGFPKSRYQAFITIELNGRRIFAKGSNWVNPELFFGRITEETYRPHIELVKNANMNILRCWGGAGAHKDAFYELCDENGILVWQEFMLACNNYVGTPHYLAVLEQEARSIIKALRRYPCLVIWGGGNELFNAWSGMNDQSHALRLLNKLCYELDFDRPFLATSPVEGIAHGGYTFWDAHSGKDVFQQFAACRFTAYTEFGVPSMATAEELRAMIPPEELYPIRDTKSWRIHHGIGSWSDDSWVCASILDRYFGEDATLEERIAHSHWLQCTGYKAIFEEARRQWPQCSMAINWCWCEPWICAANNSLVSYPTNPKPAYDAVKDSLRPFFAGAKIPRFDWNGGETFTAELWYFNDSQQEISDTVSASIRLGDTEYPLGVWETGAVPVNRNLQGPVMELNLPETADTDRLELILRSARGCGSSYVLLLRPDLGCGQS